MQQKNVKNSQNSFQAWCVCLTVGLFFFYEFFQLNSFDVLNPTIRQYFNLNSSGLSILSSVFIWANLLFLIPAGMMLDHFSVKKVVLFSLVVCMLGVVCLAWGELFWLFVLGRFLEGIGNAFCFLSCVILVSRWFSSNRQGFVMGLMVTLAFVGGMLAHSPFAYLIELSNWRIALKYDVLMGVVFWLLIYLLVKDAPAGYVRKTQTNLRDLFQAFMSVLRTPQTYLAGMYTSLLNLPIMVLCALWGTSYLQVVYSMTLMQATQIVSILFLGSMIGSPALGWISDRQGQRKPVMWLGIVGALLCFIPFWLNVHLSIAILNIIFFGLGFFTSAQILSYPLLAESNLPTHVGEATAVASLIIMGGAALGQLLFGMLIQQHAGVKVSIYSAADFQYALMMFPAAVLLAAGVLQFIREPKGDKS